MTLTLKDLLIFGDIRVVRKANGRDVEHLLFFDKRTKESKKNFFTDLSMYIMEYLVAELSKTMRCSHDKIVKAVLALHNDMHKKVDQDYKGRERVSFHKIHEY